MKVEYKSAYEKFSEFFKSKKWISDEEYHKLIRDYCVRAVYAFWHSFNKPVNYDRVVEFVLRKFMEDGMKDKIERLPSRETIERRLRETVDGKFWERGLTPCVRVKEGVYMPNPEMFSEETKKRMLEILEKESSS